MSTTIPADPCTLEAANDDYPLIALIARIAELLPSQGPITAFVFLNPLQAFEGTPFDDGLQRGAKLFRCQPYLPEEKYRDELHRDRIRMTDLAAVLREDLGTTAEASVAGLCSRFAIRSAMLRHPLRVGPDHELQWFVAETDALSRLRPEADVDLRARYIASTRRWFQSSLSADVETARAQAAGESVVNGDAKADLVAELRAFHSARSMEAWGDDRWEAVSLHALWRVCRDGSRRAAPPAMHAFEQVRHRDFLLQATNEDCDLLVHDLLIRFCAAFTDQGFSDWDLPDRSLGFFRAFCTLYGKKSLVTSPWMRSLADELTRQSQAGLTAAQSIGESLELLGVNEAEREAFLTATLLALSGWAGLLWQMEARSDRVPFPVPPGTLVEFLAIRLLLDRLAIAHLSRRELEGDVSLATLRDTLRTRMVAKPATTLDQRAFLLFQIAQVLDWTPWQLSELSTTQWVELVHEIESFSGVERRRVFHAAYERRFRVQALDALATRVGRPPQLVKRPKVQAVFCIDAREESFRRHLEENDPDVETFGAAGFFVVPMYYRGAADAHYSTLCPVVVRPAHWMVEDVVLSLQESHVQRAKTRRVLGEASHQVHKGSRSFAVGAVLTAAFGVLASIPLVARVLFPRFTARLKRTAARFVEPPPVTRLRLERATEKPGRDDAAIGFSVPEMATIAERMLRDIGLTSGFARLVLFLGHGSHCLNNPHKSAYDCGACSGAAGGPNARALAAMINDHRVRELLFRHGIEIPTDTVFLGGLHNTCSDEIAFFDLDLLPHSHVAAYEELKRLLLKTCEVNAHERCRRFHSAPLNFTPEQAHQHVEVRSQDLAQVRPEFGNASNAMCFVGRRARVRGLYLDRRSFLHSYDPTTDDSEANILGRILGAVIPVCSGINLQYFFSSVDSPGWACGTKLPHNVTSLLGVMDGYASDLRPGLPLQGVEIHEPLRLLFVIESTPALLEKIMARNPQVGRILQNGWSQLALLDPHSGKILLYRQGKYEPYTPEATQLPEVPRSVDWYRGWRDHLGFALIGLPPEAAPS